MDFARRLVVSTARGIVLVLLIAAACYVSIGRILVGNIDRFQDAIQRAAADALHTPVAISSLSGDWQHLDPIVSLGDVRIGPAEAPGITLGNLSVRVDTIASIQEGTLVLRSIELAGIHAKIVQGEDGKWTVPGLPGGEKPMNAKPLLATIAHIQDVVVSGVDVTLAGQTNTIRLVTLTGQPLLLDVQDGDRVLSLPLSVTSGNGMQAIELAGRYRGDPRIADDFDARLYMEVPGLQ
ncbi:MAG: hypothetical protein KDI19_10885, partial [Pseudomonadales bacterium]|nr:hypothetical protein [Pseudomonadales bacterium]